MATFQGLLEQDKERFLSLLSKNTSSAAVIKDVEAEFDRMLYAFNNEDENESVKQAASQMIQTAKSSVAFLDVAGETKLWKRTAYDAKPQKGKIRWFFWLLLLLSLAALGASAGLYCYLKWSELNTVADFIPVFVLLGLSLLFFLAGLSCRRKAPENDTKLEAEVTVDIQKVYRSVLSAALVIDKNIEDIRTEERIQLRKQMKEQKDSLDKEEIDLLAHILESAYSTRDEDSSVEMISQIKFYLHSKKIEVVDYNRNNTAWFDSIPAYEAGTIRPAFVIEGMLIKKGLASEGNG
ncbi:MAG: hypothetical protein IJ091_07555 [Oscillospiraceae bacterium]|nr:hypothetical protein [Oscillospiraceae bacterium]